MNAPALEFHNKTVIVTGASSGIGNTVALKFAEQGASVVLNGRNEAKLNETQRKIKEIGGESIVCRGDVTDPATAERTVKSALEHFHSIDILVNNAGINERTATLDLSLENWKNLIDINLNSAFLFSKAVLSTMRSQKSGKIINVSSKASKTPHPNASPSYGASKAALNYLTMHLALEFAQDNILVNAVCPGPIETDMTEQWSREYREKVLNTIPVNRLGTPVEVAEMIIFLASSKANFITGELININGGLYMN